MKFNYLKWDEVGSLTVSSYSDSPYLGMFINVGTINLGRFYPDYLVYSEGDDCNDNDWTYAPGLTDFAYMNQPITMCFTVVAKSVDGQSTTNYGLFHPSLKNTLKAEGVNKEGVDLTGRMSNKSTTYNDWSGAELVIKDDQFKFSKSESDHPTSSNYTTIPDGPYTSDNSQFGSYVSEIKDGLDFDFSTGIEIGGSDNLSVPHGLEFPEQPDFRYGRMTLDSVSGPIGGPIQVPLRTEYWKNGTFIRNTDDSGSQFMTSQYCRLNNVAGSDAYLTDANNATAKQTVSSGKSEIVRAAQITPQRESVRLFLRQGETQPDGTNCSWENGTQPWLQFNWRNLGDEDPSTTVIFGAYRGNDRIIYRGEPNLTAN